MFNPIIASKNIKDEFSGYISTSFHLADKDYAKQFFDALAQEGAVAKGPYLDIGDSFKTGLSLEDLINKGSVSKLFNDLEGSVPDGEKEIKIKRKLYLHQEKAIEKVNAGKNLVVTTGTGSGKTECFIIPILNHLLKEKEAGTLNDGVRAILIYPMNALANDQMKRLRATLKNYPDITFGVYNSSTQQSEKDGITKYGEIFKDEMDRPLRPLPNEIISRDSMQNKPPHILVTNYAMLEYMLLRPNDDKVFSNAQLKFLVLDEAHIYRGATGIETSLLLRRLKARISDPTKVLHILTSATLGGDKANPDIVKFAEQLCEATFYEVDIIRSETVSPTFPNNEYAIPLALFSDLADPKDSLNNILDKYKVPYDKNKSDGEIIYDLCIHSHAYKILRKCATKPYTIKELTALMQQEMQINENDVVNLINVAVQAEKDKTSLIKARYHMFARALEGAYITLKPVKRLLLKRKNTIQENEDVLKVFEASVCDDCGRVGIVGKVINNRLEFSNNRFDDDSEFYLIKEKGESFIEDDYEDEKDDQEIEKNDYLICPRCGEIHHKSLKYEFKCDHDKTQLVELVHSQRRGVKNEPKCPCCNFGHMKSFYLGYDAATAVLGTALFEQLPENEVQLKTKVKQQASEDIFAQALSESASVDIIKKKRQFLTFSDSRSEAAFYASYMTSFYEEFLRRRGIWHVVTKNAQNMSVQPWEIKDLVDELTAYFCDNRTFARPEDPTNFNLTPRSQRQAWVAVLNEMVNARRNTSLVSLGIINFSYKGNVPSIMNAVAKKYGQTESDMTALFNMLVMDIVYSGAIKGDIELKDDEKEYIYFTTTERKITKCKQPHPNKNQNYLTGWIPRNRTNGSMFQNGRVQRMVRSLGISEKDARDLLGSYWDSVLVGGMYSLNFDGNDEFHISTDKFVVTSGTENTPIYVCEKCGKTTMYYDKGNCSLVKCDGKLKRINHDDLIKDNHFAKLYSSDLMDPLHIKEHTAQLGRAEQQKYQELFVKKEINALSCSTTFEMGVDVGDLETVYLRDMPPSPANYVQRAGRAGRSLHTAAYSLTYAKLSSHDFTYYEKPERMISGEIGVPLFSIENEKVIARHIYAIALSSFLANNPDVYNGNDADIFLNQDGYERFIDFLKAKPVDLDDVLKKSIPNNLHQRMGIVDYSWVDKLIGADGVLTVAVEEFRSIVKFYEDEYRTLYKSGETQKAAQCQKKLWDYRKAKADNYGRNELIEFLVRNNVLPKYGFPVDTVELYQDMDYNGDNKLQMVRDLQLAIAEYAPGSQVVADGKLYTSRYIRKLPQKTGSNWEKVYIAQCVSPNCKTWNHRITEPSQNGEDCISCGEKIEKSKWKKAIEPRKGFIADAKADPVPLRKPDKIYRSDDYYIGDSQRQVIIKRTYEVNGTKKYQMETSKNDSLMVVCNDDFYVCDRCGYSESLGENLSKKGFNKYTSFIERPNHDAPWSKKCNGKLYKNSLCHAFKTDVVRIIFGTSRAKNQATMLSVMYALLEATSSALDIERTDIKGCLHKVRYNGSMIYSIVLYDAVAGGAGHVRRMVTDDGLVFQTIIEKAIKITKGCNCSPSCYNCLRNYYNQKIHDLLDRVDAYEFLEEYYGSVVKISDTDFEKKRVVGKSKYTENEISFKKGCPCISSSGWNDLKNLIPEEYQDLFDKFDNYIPLPTIAYPEIHIIGTNSFYEALFIWEDKKIMIFDDEMEKIEIDGWTSYYCKDISVNEFSTLF